MVHLSEETFSELVGGGFVAGADEHLASCVVCSNQLASLKNLRDRVKALPQLEAPPELWAAIEARLPIGAKSQRRLGRPALVAMQAAAMAAVFVIGLGIGSIFVGERSVDPSIGAVTLTSDGQAGSLAAALEQVQRQGAEYDAALRRLEAIAGQAGTPMPSVAVERLAALDVLLEAARTALATEPADPVLNTYLFAALEERDDVLRQLAATQGQTNTEMAWR